MSGVAEKFSYSKLDTFRTCPYQFYLRYVEKREATLPLALHLLSGTSLHAALENFFSGEYSYSRLASSWSEECTREQGALSKQSHSWIDELHKRAFYQDGWSVLDKFFVDNYDRFSSPTYKVLELEKSFEIPFKDWTLRGSIDKLESHYDDFNVWISDYKTGRYVSSQEEVNKDFQLTIYSLAYRTLYEQRERGLYLHFIRENKVVVTRRDRTHYDSLARVLDGVTQLIQREEYVARPSSQSCRYCDFNQTCEFSQEKKTFLEW